MRRIALALCGLSVLVGVLLAPATGSSVAAPRGTATVQILALNDFHGNLLPPLGASAKVTTSIGADGKPVEIDAGGVQYLATHLKRLKATNPRNTILTSAGDLVGASPEISRLFHDEPAIEALNLMGFAVNGVGNHEFDEGTAELTRLRKGGCHPTDGCADGTPFRGSRFDFLAGNVYRDPGLTKPFLPPYEVIAVGGVRVGIIGVATDLTPRSPLVKPAGVAALTFVNQAESINRWARVLKRLGVHAIVVLLHDGGAQSGTTQTMNTCEGLTGEITKIVPALDRDVDVVLSAHTHQAYTCTLNGMLVTSAASYGRLITRVQLMVSRATGNVVAKSATNVAVTRDVRKDPALTALVRRYAAAAVRLRNRVLGRATELVQRAQNAAGESALGDLIADAQLEATAPANAGGGVVAFLNLSFARQEIGAGDVTYGDLLQVHPFEMALNTKTCTGAQIKAVLEQQFDNPSAGRVNVLQVSKGFTYSYRLSAPRGSRVDPNSIKINGGVLNPSAGYRVTTNSFLARGIEGFGAFAQCTDSFSGPVDIEALASYVRRHSPVAPPVRNRIVRTD